MLNVFCKKYNQNLKKLQEASQIESFIIFKLKTKHQFCLSLVLTS